MIESYVRNVIEAALLAAGRPLTLADLRALFDEPSRPEDPALEAALEQLGAAYVERGIELKQTASGWRIQVRREFAAEVSRLWPERPARYSRALLETLALIAYRQPITRGEIEDVRGVAVNPNIVKTLLERNWIRVVGQRDVPGRPELLGTTREFLDYFGLKSLDELPALSELKALTELNLQLDLPAGAAEAPAAGSDGQSEAPADAPGAETSAGDGDGADAASQASAEEQPRDADPPVEEGGETAPAAQRPAEEADAEPDVEDPESAQADAGEDHESPPRQMLAASDGERG